MHNVLEFRATTGQNEPSETEQGVTDILYTCLDDGQVLANKYKLELSSTGTSCT